MPKWLAKEYGPFSGGVWVVVIVGGVGLGLLMRRFMVSRGDSTAAAYPAVTDPGFTGVTPVSSGTGTFYNQGEIVSDVVAAINAQKPPVPTTNPIPPPVPLYSGPVPKSTDRGSYSDILRAIQQNEAAE